VQAQLVASLQNQTRAQQAVLVQAVATQQKAEAALSTQIAAASAAETADLDTAAREAAAEAAADQNIQSLQGMINKLRARERAAAARHAAKRNFPPTPGGAPVAGTIVQAYGAPTVAGPAVGLVYRAAPAARVVAPCAGPILYANRFQSYGLLIIMDCGNNYDFVLSGMRHLDVTAGQDIARGQPVGEMAGFDPKNPAQQPLLYVELRLNGTPVNPAAWLAGGGSG
jgi:septal ring factor EnvC (AmiA/AmiB activator)